MKNFYFLICVAVSMLMVSSCNNGRNGSRTWSSQNQSANPETFMEEMSEQFTQFMNQEFSNFIDSKSEKAAPVKKPSFNEKEVKKELEYELILSGGNETSFKLPVGHFEVEDDQNLEVYALLADNGLITFSSSSIKVDGRNNYSTWADVALTSKGKKFTADNNVFDSVKGLDKKKYKKVLHPAKDRNAYGELEEEPVTNQGIIKLFSSFYTALVAEGENAAIKTCGEKEFIEAFSRIRKIDSYMKVLEIDPQVPEKAFTAGMDIDATSAQEISIVAVTKYQNCYKVYFKNEKSVVFLLTQDGAQIFDLVLDVDENATLRTKNAAWSDADVKMYADMASAPTADITTEEDLGLEKVWYAPGLILVGENDKSRYVYPEEVENAIEETVQIRLYNTVVDKIYNVRILTTENDEDKGNDYDYTAIADVVYKKVNITPFQLVLQKAGVVDALDKTNIYVKNQKQFRHFDDRAWGIPAEDSVFEGNDESVYGFNTKASSSRFGFGASINAYGWD